MGKRKSKKILPPKKRPKLDTVFTCPFCNHEKSVECDMDWELKIGVVSCCICSESYSTNIRVLSEPIDVYSEWIDECEKANDFED